MVAIAGFVVQVSLKSGNQIQGSVKKCASKQLFLKVNGEPVVLDANDIADLKVVDVPAHLKKKKDKENKKDKDTKKTKNKQNNDRKDRQQDKNDYSGAGYVAGNETFDSSISNIQSSGDFDFEKSTAEFNKQWALKEFTDNDAIDAADRLVGHNKVKTKFAHDEMVLPTGTSNAKTNTSIASPASPRPRSIQLSSNGVVIPFATPVQLLQIETTTTDVLSHHPSILTETASLNIKQLVIKILGGVGRIANNHNSAPVIIVAVSNNKAGARGIAVARQLHNLGCTVIIYSPVSLSTEDIDEQIDEQLQLWSAIKAPAFITSFDDLTTKVNSLSPELIIDALQGYDTNITDLTLEDQDSTVQLIAYLNASSISTLSLDIPSGIDSGSGVAQGEFIRAKHVVSLGLPLVGLSHAYENGMVGAGDWRHYLAELGIPRVVFGKGVLKKFEAVSSVASGWSSLETAT